MPADPDLQLKKWILDFVKAESEGTAVETWVGRVLSRIVRDLAEVRDDAALQRVVKDACTAHWRAFLANLAQPEQTFHLVQEAREVPMVVAQHGYPLPVIFQMYTAAEQAVWEFITEAVSDLAVPGVREADALVYFWTRSSTWFDRSVEESVAIHQEEVDRIRQGDAARRLEVVGELLAGRLVDPREASARLGGHPMSCNQTAIMLHTAADARIADLPQMAAAMTTALDLHHPLVVHPGGRDLWAWVGSTDVPDLSLLGACRSWLQEHEVIATVGTPLPGIDGFCSSHRQARDAQQVCLASPNPAPLTFFTDVELMTLVGDTAAMRRFVHRVLGNLGAPDEHADRLRRTLHALLSMGSVEAAAKELSVHKNTVRYRIEKAEEAMGRRVSDEPTEIAMALRCHAAFLSRSSTRESAPAVEPTRGDRPQPSAGETPRSTHPN